MSTRRRRRSTREPAVLETVDRYARGHLVDYEIPADLERPPDAVVIVDAITGEILETMRAITLPWEKR